jgi:Tol biopolymer transport system component
VTRGVVLAAALAAVAAPAAAQQAGPNKVQYRTQHFRVLRTSHFDIYFHLAEREPVDIAARLAERWWVRLSQFFDAQPHGRQPLVLYGSHADFQQTAIVPDAIGLETGGITESWRRRIVVPFAGSLAETDHVIGHELVHAFQFQLTAGRRTTLPLWFTEGLAEFLTLGSVNTHTAMWLRDAVLYEDLPSIARLGRPRYFPYRWGHAFWAYIAATWGRGAAADLFAAAAAEGLPEAIGRVLGLTPDAFDAEWHAAIRAAYTPAGEPLTAVGRPLVVARTPAGTADLAPALSPDGRWIAFLSERGVVSMDLFIGDASTGGIVARLTDAGADARDANLQFMESSGAWDRESRRLAVATITRGRAGLVVFAWPAGTREIEVSVDEVDEIYSPTWSPDGRAIAFTGKAGGVTDLFVLDLARRKLRRLTRDPFADLQPAWEPGGRRIAFVTDRFTSDLRTLAFGEYRLALLDLRSGTVEPVAAFGTGKHISPQWSPDRRALYFVSDRDGTPNVYRVELAGGRVHRLTDVPSGVSGLTATSPSLSVAAHAGGMAVNVFGRGAFSIRGLVEGGGEAIDGEGGTAAPAAPHEPASPGSWAGESPQGAAAGSPVAPYAPRLSLERVADASFGAGIDRLGAAARGGIGFMFSDILNMHWLVAALELNRGLLPGSSVRDAAASVAYLNQVHRWHWGFVGSRTPSYVATRWVPSTASPRPARVALMRQTEHTATAVATYAFDRTRRLELQAGISRLTFERDAAPLTVGATSAALVGDTTVRGAISALRGERYRVEVAPALGDVGHVAVLADYRRYAMPIPFYTVAARALYAARFGDGAVHPRLPPMYVGDPSLVRGYDVTSDFDGECAVPAAGGCARVHDLLGRGVAVANLELRFPLLRPFGLSSRMYGPIPSELALFLDGGVALRPLTPEQAWGRGVWSAGATVRASIFGLGLGQVDLARRLGGRTGRGWVLQMSLAPAL